MPNQGIGEEKGDESALLGGGLLGLERQVFFEGIEASLAGIDSGGRIRLLLFGGNAVFLFEWRTVGGIVSFLLGCTSASHGS
jgi:hypothetical protein